MFLCVTVMSGCSHQLLKDSTPLKVSEAELLSGKGLFANQYANITLPEDKVLKLSDEMISFLDRYIPKDASKNRKFTMLRSIVFNKGNLGMEYNQALTLTARDAFRIGAGNCLAFSYLFASMARRVGLRVSYQDVDIPPEWRMNNKLSYFFRHVNVAVKLPRGQTFIVDIDSVRNKPYYQTKRLSERNVVAQYYENIGVEYLVKKDSLNAFRYFIKAISLDATQSEFWSNLGVLYRRAGKNDHAESAYLISLAKKNDNYTAMNNLVSLYQITEDKVREEKYRKLSQKHYDKNPYYRYFQAYSDYELGDYDASLPNIKWAINHKKNEPDFYYLLAKIYDETGDPERAKSVREKGEKIEKSTFRKNHYQRTHKKVFGNFRMMK